MNNIIKAIEIEDYYFKCRTKNEYPFHLIDKIKECGFKTLKEYFKAKQLYKFENLEFNYVEELISNGVSEAFKMIEANQAGVLFANWDDTYVVSGTNGMETLNKEYCEENNITIFNLHMAGGAIVGSEDDFSFGICYPKDIRISFNFILNEMKNILQRYTDKNIEVKGNDIVVDNKKVCGTTVYDGKDVLMVILYFSFSDKSELINNICITNKVNKPVGYIDFITKDVFKKEVSTWLRV